MIKEADTRPAHAIRRLRSEQPPGSASFSGNKGQLVLKLFWEFSRACERPTKILVAPTGAVTQKMIRPRSNFAISFGLHKAFTGSCRALTVRTNAMKLICKH